MATKANEKSLVDCVRWLIEARDRFGKWGFIGSHDEIDDVLNDLRSDLPDLLWKVDDPENDRIVGVEAVRGD